MPNPAEPPLISPQQWAKDFPSRPVLQSDSATFQDGLLQRWNDTAKVTCQPPLDHHNVALHLGGDKRVSRAGEGHRRVADVGSGAMSVVPSGATFSWTTEGPIDFAHLYIAPKRLDEVVAEEFDRDPAAVFLQDSLGCTDPRLYVLYEALMEEIRSPGPAAGVCIESLYQALLVRVLISHSNLPDSSARAVYALAPYRLRRVTDYIQQNLGGELDLGVLAHVAGLSRFHFSRTFRRATGMAPHSFIVQRRIAEAKRLLRARRLGIAAVARACGFSDSARFATSFRKVTGKSPTEYRDCY